MAVLVRNLIQSTIWLPSPIGLSVGPFKERTFPFVEYDEVINTESISELIAKKIIRVVDLDGLAGVPFHAPLHQNGGADEVNVGGLSGVLTDPQPPIVTATAPTTIGVGDTADAGTATGEAARPDHRHAAPAGTPVSIGTTNADGSSGDFSHSDHVHQIPIQSTAPSSPAAGQLWFNTATGWNVLMIYDGARSKWMSTTEWPVGFGRDVADGNTLLGYGISAAGTGTGVAMPRDATIKRLAAHAAAGNLTKTFDLLVNDLSVLNFSLTAGDFVNNSLDLDIDQNDYIWCEASSAGIAANDVIVTAWISWRV